MDYCRKIPKKNPVDPGKKPFFIDYLRDNSAQGNAWMGMR